jgi:hypothetical protein
MVMTVRQAATEESLDNSPLGANIDNVKAAIRRSHALGSQSITAAALAPGTRRATNAPRHFPP